MNRQTAEELLWREAAEIDYLENAKASLSWDMRVNLPPAAGEYRGEMIGFLAGQIYERKTSEKMNEILCCLEEEAAEGNSAVLSAMIRKFRREYRYLREVPPELNRECAAHILKTEVMWRRAKAENDFPLIIPWMKREFDLLKETAAAHGYKDDPMTALMSAGDPGITREKADRLFSELKAFLLPFLDRLRGAAVPVAKMDLVGPFSKNSQEEFCAEILGTIGYDFSRGRIDEGAHPYTTANDRSDIRLVTRYPEQNFLSGLISCLHEGGHAMHWQNTMPALSGTTLEKVPYDALCESQSRFIENMIGRSYEFWEYCLPAARRYFPQLEGTAPGEIFRTLSALNFTADRLDSDEITYNLHIMIRYEIEKLLFDGAVSFEDLPAIWSDKYAEYLGVCPENDAKGVLSDMHWYSGYAGYFQSYVMGNLYDGHFYDAMRKEIPDMYEQIRRGNFENVTGWLKEHIQKYGGMYEPAELLKMADGEELSAGHYIGYLREKYGKLYGLAG